jgi:hypothetical protein
MIYVGCAWAADRNLPTLDAVRAAMLMLNHGSFGGTWTDVRLCGLASEYASGPTPIQALDIRLIVKRLIPLHRALIRLDRDHRRNVKELVRAIGEEKPSDRRVEAPARQWRAA